MLGFEPENIGLAGLDGKRGEGRGAVGVNRVQWLDQLRGLAAIVVVFHHLILSKTNLQVFQYLDAGTFGVALFFFVSGYIIPKSIKEKSHYAALRFVRARFFRLYPTYWVSLALGIAAFGFTPHQLEANLTMLQRFVGIPDIVGVYWTLQVEIMFYALVVALLVSGMLRRLNVVLSLSICWAAVAAFLGFGRALYSHKYPMAPAIGLSFMFLATGLTYYESGLRGLREHRALIISTIVTTLLLYLSFFLGYGRDWGFNENPYRFVLTDTLAAGCFLSFRFIQPKLLSGPLLFLGKISYPTYLVHTSVIELFDRYSGLAPLEPISLMSKLTLILVIAWVLHATIEQPMISLGRRFMRTATA